VHQLKTLLTLQGGRLYPCPRRRSPPPTLAPGLRGPRTAHRWKVGVESHSLVFPLIRFLPVTERLAADYAETRDTTHLEGQTSVPKENNTNVIKNWRKSSHAERLLELMREPSVKVRQRTDACGCDRRDIFPERRVWGAAMWARRLQRRVFAPS